MMPLICLVVAIGLVQVLQLIVRNVYEVQIAIVHHEGTKDTKVSDK